MSNPRAWRGRGRTTVPNSRQKRNKLFLDANPWCQDCGKRPAEEAHHELPHGHSERCDWRHMRALCVTCHVAAHRTVRVIMVIASGA